MKDTTKYWPEKAMLLSAGLFLSVIIVTIIYTKLHKQYFVLPMLLGASSFIVAGSISISILLAAISIFLYKKLAVNDSKLEDALKNKDLISWRSASILNALPANIVLLDKAGTIIEVNSSWKAFAEKNEFIADNYGIGSNYIDFAEKSCGESEEDAHNIVRKLKQLIQGEIQNFSLIYPYHSSIKKQWFKVIATLDSEKNNAKITLMHFDITERYEAEEKIKQSESNLRQSEEELRALFAAMTDLVIVLNAEGEYISIAPTNPSGPYKPSEDLIGRNIQEVLPPGDGEKILAKIRMALLQAHPVDFEYNLIIDNKQVWFEGNVSPLTNNTVFLVARDITERKLAELDRSKITIDLIQRNKDLEQFAYIISHNLRAPVANIMGVTDILNNIELNQEEEKQMTEALSASVNKLDIVIKDLNYILQVKREVSEQKEVVKFTELVDDVKLSIGNIIGKEEAQLICNFSEVDEIVTLKSYLYSVFFNLILNSIKYRQPHVRPLIEISSVRSGNKTKLVFKDNGLGIDLKTSSDQVFGLYKRFHFHTEGKGMGLYMVKTQVETLGGKISIHSKVNKGTKFRIEFEN